MGKEKRQSPSTLLWFIRHKSYVPISEIRRRFLVESEEGSFIQAGARRRAYVGLPQGTAQSLEKLWQQGKIGLELSVEFDADVLIGVYPMIPSKEPMNGHEFGRRPALPRVEPQHLAPEAPQHPPHPLPQAAVATPQSEESAPQPEGSAPQSEGSAPQSRESGSQQSGESAPQSGESASQSGEPGSQQSGESASQSREPAPQSGESASQSGESAPPQYSPQAVETSSHLGGPASQQSGESAPPPYSSQAVETSSLPGESVPQHLESGSGPAENGLEAAGEAPQVPGAELEEEVVSDDRSG
jgi:hypothetical protein